MKRLDKLTLQLRCLNSRARLISHLVPNVRKLLEGSTVTVRLKMNKLERRRKTLRGWKKRQVKQECGSDERRQNRAGGGDRHSQIEEWPPRHSLILPS